MDDELLKNIDLFNVAEAKKTMYGYRLYRFPKEIRDKFSNFGAYVSGYSDSCEIRFIRKKGAYVRVTLISENSQGLVSVYFGDRIVKNTVANQGVITTLDISDAPLSDFYNEEFYKDDIYSPSLVRIILSNSSFILCDVECFGDTIRKPKKDEIPKITFVAYGSSITHNAASIANQFNYINQTARLLGAQVINKGMGGSCFVEKEVCDYLVNFDYDFFLYESGTNMYNTKLEKFVYERSKYLIDEHFKLHPDKYFFLIEPLLPKERSQMTQHYKEYMEEIRRLHKNINNDKCILIPAEVVEDKYTYISADGIHPSTEGHMSMGLNVFNFVKKFL